MHSSISFFGFIFLYGIISNCDMLGAQTIQQDQGIYFQFIKEKILSWKKSFSSLKLLSYSSDRTGCVAYCLTYSSCKCANFRISTGECSLFGMNSWEIEFTIIADLDNIIVQKLSETVVNHGEWTLVFRGQANIGKSVYDAYTNTSLSHDQPLIPMYPIGCLRLDTNLSCDHHFRSNLLNSWSKLTITEVKLVICKDGVVEKYLLFNGSLSTIITWFLPSNFVSSSWTDLTRSSMPSFFSLEGYHDTEVTRRFYIERSHTGCDLDSGWFVCVDTPWDRCAWAKPVSPFPRFLYSPTDTGVTNVNMMAADVIAIFIKF